MSEDSYGTRGVLQLEAGETIDWQWFMKADHGGFYRWEMAPGQEPSNAEFMANPMTAWYSLHESAETYPATFPNRFVGWEKSDTDFYLSQQHTVGQALGADRRNQFEEEMNSEYCRDPANYDECFMDDKITIPSNTPPGTYVFRFNWMGAEVRQVYNNCMDVEVVAPLGCPGGTFTACVNGCLPDNNYNYAECVDNCMNVCNAAPTPAPPTNAPTPAPPTSEPTPAPPTSNPSAAPTFPPTLEPSKAPTMPTSEPTLAPTPPPTTCSVAWEKCGDGLPVCCAGTTCMGSTWDQMCYP
jgi:hypothetical protein